MKKTISIIAVLIFAVATEYACKCKISTDFVKATSLAENVVYGVAMEPIYTKISPLSIEEANRQNTFKIISQFKGHIYHKRIIIKSDVYLESGKYYVLALGKENDCMVCENSVLKFEGEITTGKIDSIDEISISKDNLFRLMEYLFPDNIIENDFDENSL